MELTRICFCVLADVLLCHPYVTTEDRARILNIIVRTYITKHL